MNVINSPYEPLWTLCSLGNGIPDFVMVKKSALLLNKPECNQSKSSASKRWIENFLKSST